MIISPDLRPCKAASDWLCYLVMNYERVTLLEDRGRPEPQSRSQTSALTACFPRRFLDTELCIRCAPNSRAVCHDASHSVGSILAAGACAGEQTLRAPRSPARAFVSFHPTPSRARGLRAGVAGIRPEWGPVERPRRLRGEPPARAPAQRGLSLAIPLPVPPHSPPVNGG